MNNLRINFKKAINDTYRAQFLKLVHLKRLNYQFFAQHLMGLALLRHCRRCSFSNDHGQKRHAVEANGLDQNTVHTLTSRIFATENSLLTRTTMLASDRGNGTFLEIVPEIAKFYGFRWIAFRWSANLFKRIFTL